MFFPHNPTYLAIIQSNFLNQSLMTYTHQYLDNRSGQNKTHSIHLTFHSTIIYQALNYVQGSTVQQNFLR